ncbi:hemicentin-1-like isoform X1 [Limulus polyphemus]|uniref:Hemicentin-1-like isoform X1 n=1 Tax=Limulus polyphemus TaxID=6850 RepID=A0ABM1SCA1_LIMPO|nr:hemicentin-1-like isoform X1 [Limulus polyphemus]
MKTAIPCNITPPNSNDDVSLVLWYRGDTSNPLYSFDARRGHTSLGHHSPTDSLSDRALFSVIARPALLILDPVIEGDAGTYKCRVDFRVARTRYSKAELSIIIPPKKTIVRDTHGQVLESLVGPYNEGESLTLVCESEGGKPLPSVSWWRESVLLDTTYEIISKNIVQNTLLIPMLERQHLMATFSCQATNNNQTLPQSSTVTVDMNFRPLAVKLTNKNRPLSADHSSNLRCTAGGSRPPAQISWWKGSMQLKSAKILTPPDVGTNGNITVSVLTIIPTSDDNGKYLSCRAENVLIPGSAIEDGWKLQVHFVPQLSLRLGSKLRHSRIQEGSNVYFECNIRANPSATYISWNFEGLELQANTSTGVIISNQSLVLQKVHRSSRGRYTCLATNSEGQGESNAVFLRVQYPPQCKKDQKFIYAATMNEGVKISCELEADPTDVTFEWKFNSSGGVVDIINFINDGATSYATIIPRNQDDYGSLYCWGTNIAGTQNNPCIYNVIPADFPEALRNCNVTNQTDSSFRVVCEEGYDGGMSQLFIMEIHDTTHNVIRSNLTSRAPVFHAKGLPPDSNFVVVLYAVNGKGRGEAVMLRPGTLKVPETLTQKDTHWNVTLNPLFIVFSGIVGGLVLIAILIVCVLKFRAKRVQPRMRGTSGVTTASGFFSHVVILKGNRQQTTRNEIKEPEPEKYEEPEAKLEATRKKCPDIIPGVSIGEHHGVNKNVYDDLKEDYNIQEEGNIWTANKHLPQNQSFEMDPLQIQSHLINNDEEYVGPQSYWSSCQPNIKGVRVLPSPTLHTFVYDTDQPDLHLIPPRQTDV